MSYTNALIILFAVIFALGYIFYATYRVSMRAVLREYRFFRPEGTLEIKEHLLPLALLPVYWPLGAGYPSGPAALTCVRPAEPSDRHMIDNIRELDHDEAGTSCCDLGVAFAFTCAPTMDCNSKATYHPIRLIWQLGQAAWWGLTSRCRSVRSSTSVFACDEDLIAFGTTTRRGFGREKTGTMAEPVRAAVAESEQVECYR